MDYTKQPAWFQLRKALRYAGMYGLRRTLVKIEGQYHMKKTFAVLPSPRGREGKGGHIGIVGCGNFAYSNIAYYLRRNFGPVLRAAMDVNIHRAASLYETYGLAYYTDDPERIFSDPRIDLVFIASNHASHAEYAIRALESGKHVHIEKPHVVSEDQLRRLCAAMARSEGRVALGFNRPNSRIGETIRRALASESGPGMYNWFIAGHEIDPDHWYFRPEEGGRVLGNLCHWTDFLYRLVPPEGRFPLKIVPVRAEKPDSDIAVSYVFADGSIAAITFSAKGHTFEGVKERFAAHRGNVLLTMDDFRRLEVERVEKKQVISPWRRDHGHETTIRRSCEMAAGRVEFSASVSTVWETGQIFLKTREALEADRAVTVEGFSG